MTNLQKRFAVFIAFLITLSAVTHCEASENFKTLAKTSFSQSIIKSIEYSNGTGKILFKFDDEYFGTGDKINKICAIETARLFMKMQNLNGLKIAIPLSKNQRTYRRGIYTLHITRPMIERYYGMIFSKELRKNNYNLWRKKFIQKYDNKRMRKAFASKFVRFSKL